MKIKFKEFIDKNFKELVYIILGVMFVLMVLSVRKDAAIRDEMPHIVAGYSYLTKFDYRLNPEHPPLVKQLAALPLIFMDVNFPSDSVHWKDRVNDQWALGEEFLYYSGNDADKILFWARMPIVLLTLLAGYFVFKFAQDVFRSKTAGLLALMMFAFSPNVMAHGRFVTTDMGITAVSIITLYTWYLFLREPSYKKFFIASVLQAALHLSKFSSPLFLPAIWLMAIFAIFVYQKRWGILKRLWFYSGVCVASSAIAFVLIGFWYAIFMHKMPLLTQQQLIRESATYEILQRDMAVLDGKNVVTVLLDLSNKPILRPHVQYFLGFFMVFGHSDSGHDTYFMGEVGQNWWNYYFIAYFFKEPIALQIFLLMSLVILGELFFDFTRISDKRKIFSEFFYNYNVLFVFVLLIAGFLYLGIKSNLQIGIRYVLPIFPYLYIMVGGIVAAGYGMQQGWLAKVRPWLLGFLLVWFVGANLMIYPSYLAYFNEYAGGYKNGWCYLSDSNLDWGQDLRRLKEYVDENDVQDLKIDYFGGGNLDYYLGEGNYTVWGYDKGKTDGWIVLSANAILWNVKRSDEEGNYKWLTENYKPVKQIGGSIFVYHVE